MDQARNLIELALGQVRKSLGFFVGVAIVTALLCTKGGGFMLIFVGPIVALWALVEFAQGHTDPSRLRRMRLPFLTWVVALSSVGITHYYYAVHARTEASELLERITTFKGITGRYPASPVDLQINQMKAPFFRPYYNFDERGPHLFYVATFEPFSVWNYNFSTDQWVYHPG